MFLVVAWLARLEGVRLRSQLVKVSTVLFNAVHSEAVLCMFVPQLGHLDCIRKAVVLIGNKWTADALREIGQSTRGAT